jgi:hypothetical protein
MSNVDPSRQEHHDDGLGRLVRRVLSPGPTPEERLEELLAERRRELDETAARFDASIADLERREELLRDSRASVERLLRLGRSDLEARETELTTFLRELTEREARLAEAEAEIARRRQDLGAVELKRAALERRERDVAAREAQLAELESQLADRATLDLARDRPTETAELAFVPGPAYRLVEHPLSEVAAGTTVELEGVEYAVGRLGPSPLPGDRRRCAYLARPASGQSGDGLRV